MGSGSNSVEKGVVANDEHTPKKSRGCCLCAWYYWLGGFLLFVLVFMLVFVYGIVPPVAQKSVDKTWIELHALQIFNPRPDGFDLTMDSTIKGSKIHSAVIDGFEANFFLEKHDPPRPFMSVDIPKVKATKAIPVKVENRPTSVLNAGSFVEFALTLMGLEELRVAIRGRTKIWLGKIGANVHYNEVVTMKGFNHLSGMKIDSYNISLSGPYNLIGKVFIPNPSVVTLQLGDVNLDFFKDGARIGNGTLPNLTLTPGNNTYDFNARMELTRVLPIMTSNNPVIQTRGTGVVFNGREIPWLTAPLSNEIAVALH